MTIRWAVSAVVILVVTTSFATSWAQDPAKGFGPDPKDWEKAVTGGVTYLKSRQAGDGTWNKASSPALTGIVLNALFRSGKVKADDPVAAKALKYIESTVDAKEGHIAGAGARVNLQNYGTCVNLLALKASGEDQKYAKVIANAVAFLKKLQWDETEGKTPNDDIYGGAGYGGNSRPDLSNTQFLLDAMKAAGVPKDDLVYKKALIYVSRCQNLRSEYNDQPWADKINDGSFIYGAGPAGETRGDPGSDGARPGYGSMTYAGLKSLAACGVSQDDPRFKKGFEWICKNYSVDLNPGMPAGAGQRGYYYYLATMAKCLETLGIDEVTDAAGKKHDWRAEITTALINRQKKDGSWTNEIASWMESDPELVTSYALLALSHCAPKAK